MSGATIDGRDASRARIAAGCARHGWLLARRATQLGLLALVPARTARRRVDRQGQPVVEPHARRPAAHRSVSSCSQSLAAGHAPADTALARRGDRGRVLPARRRARVLRMGVPGEHGDRQRGLAAPAARARRRARRRPSSSATGCSAPRSPPRTATGTIVWEFVNPVSMLHRGLLFGVGLAWLVVLAVFLFDLLVAPRGWCGHVCPVGAFYGLIGKACPAARRRAATRRVRRLRRLLRGLPRSPGHHAGAERKGTRHAGHHRPRTAPTAAAASTSASAKVFRFTHRFDRREAS